MELNVEDYINDLDGWDMTREEKVQLLEELWTMMEALVRLDI